MGEVVADGGDQVQGAVEVRQRLAEQGIEAAAELRRPASA